MHKFRNLLQDKPVLALLLLILVAGIFLRVYDFNEVGIWNDDQTTIPTGLAWFYEHSSYPGLLGQGEPALGNLLVGAGCMLSGEDFSGVKQIVPMFYPGREVLLSNIAGAMGYCKFPGVLFGIVLLFLVAILLLAMFDKYAALLATAFYAFYPPLIQLSTFIHVDVFAYVFIASSLICLYMFYAANKGRVSEKVWFGASLFFASLAFGTKLPCLAFILFAFLLLAEKNFETIKNWLGKVMELSFVKGGEEIDFKPFLENLFIGLGVVAATVFVVFEFSFSNVLKVMAKYKADSSSDLAALGLNSGFLNYIYNFFFSANILDILLFLASLYIIIRMAIKFKELHRNERFLLYLYAMFIAVNLFMETFKIVRVMLMFSFPIILAMSMSLSSRFSFVPKRLVRSTVLIVALLYLIVGASFAFSVSPHFFSCNPLLEKFTPEKCNKDYSSVAIKQVAEKLGPMMSDDETFVNVDADMLYYYLRPEQSMPSYQFRLLFRQQSGGRDPYLDEQINYFAPPMNRTARYVMVNPVAYSEDPAVKRFLVENEPNEVVYLKKWPVMNVYDLENLKLKV